VRDSLPLTAQPNFPRRIRTNSTTIRRTGNVEPDRCVMTARVKGRYVRSCEKLGQSTLVPAAIVRQETTFVKWFS
jgi:hypothetical protein